METILTALVLIVSLCVIFICADIFTVARMFERLRRDMAARSERLLREVAEADYRSAVIGKTLCDLIEKTDKLASEIQECRRIMARLEPDD